MFEKNEEAFAFFFLHFYDNNDDESAVQIEHGIVLN
jgi:hypothetical protein